MMIERFFVKGLFGIFDNEIVFKEGGITVVVGQNGCGKTTMLRMLAAIFSKNHSQLFQYRFDYIELSMSNRVLKIKPIDEQVNDEDGKITVKSLQYSINSVVLDKHHRENSKITSPTFWIRAIPSLRRRAGGFFVDRDGEVLTLSEVIETYFDTLPEEIKNDIIEIPNEIFELTGGLQIELITTERLKAINWGDEFRRYDFIQKYAVEECSAELRSNLKNILSEYANISQKLDEQFPAKILNAIKQKQSFSADELSRSIQEIDMLREKHVNAGVLEENTDSFLSMDVTPERLDDITAKILSVYYQDMRTKLESLNSISDKIVLFKNVLASKFNSNKLISIDMTNGIAVTQQLQNEPIALSSLSSGEQQELVLLYNLIFNGDAQKLVLLDEPEISLNVSWQREFLDDMKKIVAMNGVSILIATHSPQIVSENWDLVATLGE